MCLVMMFCMLSDLIGEVPEVQPVSNISTAADLLKQGAGESMDLLIDEKYTAMTPTGRGTMGR